MTTIHYNGNPYTARSLNIPGYGLGLLIATTQLSSVLIDENGNPYNPNARDIDEDIFFYCEPDQIALPTKQLKGIIKSNL